MHWIKREVRNLQEQYHTSDPFELADYLEYILVPFPFRKIRGMLLVFEGTTFIGYNNTLPYREQKLVIYHEIAHRRLHPSLNYFMVLDNLRSICIGKYERQVDRFVAELLLSEKKPEPGESIYEFARRYDVPVKLVETLAPYWIANSE
ncbi:hypothetical protein P378_12005 [Desulforamulus profundi]|uniref:IrrE N-terminal-like domain-containing protein n=2 Tax=Desulforamulus profundi TaxID=1383067 RepID=A0A2C6MA54_9FIRM|nr:ImmA/IrrE family metallo-endopeptidase [Desulforamulus profundi]PHJ38059.1 hypothetical protein P378_12005 [Desulforamulus profundi]